MFSKKGCYYCARRRSATVSNKNTHQAVFETCLFRLYLRLQKSFSHLFASFSEKFSDEKRVFQIQSQNLLIFAKTLFCQKKVSYQKKSAFFLNQKFFFMDWTYIQTSFRLKNHHATSLSQARCVYSIFVNQISISCHNTYEQIRYLFLSMCCLLIGHIFDKKFFFSFRNHFNDS